MDNNNWRPVQAKEEPATDNGDWRPAQAKEEPATDNGDWRPAKAKDEPATDNGDWRIQLQNESRQRIVKKIMDTLMRHLPHSGQQGLQDLKNIAMRFEEKIYTGATSQADYLRKISVKMITMESKSQNPTANSLPSSNNTADAGPLLPVTMEANQGQPPRQFLSPNIQNNNITATGLQSSSCLASSIPNGRSLPQTSMPSVAQNINVQSISGITQNSGANTMGRGVPVNTYANSQRQMQGRQQVLAQQQHQNPQQILYQQHSQNYSQGTIQNSQMQQQNSLQASQQGLQPNLQQNKQFLVQQLQTMPKQNPQSVLRKHQQILAQQPNSTSMNSGQLFGQKTNLSKLQQQPPQLLTSQLGLQGNLPGLQQQQMLGTESGNNPSMQNNQNLGHIMHQTKVSTLQQNYQNTTALLPSQGQHSQPQAPHQQINPQLRQRLQRTMPEVPSSPLDSTAQTGNGNSGDWQEETYQKILTMKEAYYSELREMHTKIASKLHQIFRIIQHDTLPHQPRSEQVEKLKAFKSMLERVLVFLQVSKSNILPIFKDKLGSYEKQIVNILYSNRPRKPESQVQQPQEQSQISQVQSHVNPMSSRVQSMNLQGSMNTLQHNANSLQQDPLSSLSRVPNSSQSLMNPLQSISNIDSVQGNLLNTMQQSVSAPQQVNTNTLSSQNGMSSLQPNHSPFQRTSNIIGNQQLRQQEQQMLQNHQTRQKFQQHQMQQQLIHKQQLQQQMLQQKLRQNNQLQAHQMPRLHQMNDMETKMRQQLGVNGGSFQQNQRPIHHPQQFKSSPQLFQATSPQMPPQHSSPSRTKSGTPSQSANSHFIVPSPSTPLAPSPMQGEPEKGISGTSPLTTTAAVTPAQSLAVGTPGISTSPLLEVTSPVETHGNISTAVSGKSSPTEQPIDRLLKAVKSMSQKTLSASVSDIDSVIGMVDTIAGSAPGYGSRAALGENLVAMTKCRVQARNFITKETDGGTRKWRRYTSVMPFNVAPYVGSVNNYNFNGLTGTETEDLKSTATSNSKRPRVEASLALMEEIREINQRLIDTVVDVSNDHIDATAAAAEGTKGTIIECSFDLNFQYAHMSPIRPLRLLVPANYPNSSPILLESSPIKVRKEYEDLSSKVMTRFSRSLQNLSDPMSIGEIARTWNVCARGIISECAQKSGGGSFSSSFGTWKNCLSAA